MTSRTLPILATILGVLLVAGAGADAPHIYAITNVRIVTAAGAPIPSGTIVIRNGLIESVGAGLQAPRDASVIDGKGLTAYPGLIDMGNTAVADVPTPPQPQNPKTREEVERWKRAALLRPEIEAAGYVKVDAPDLTGLASAGITSVLALPAGEVVSGRSSLVNVVAPPDEPQIGALADERRGAIVVKTPVALHVAFPNRPTGDGYPESLMGVIAFVRQSLLDAQHYQLEWARYERLSQGVVRPLHDPSLAALRPIIEGRLPVGFEADGAHEIRRALNLAREFKLDPLITGAVESGQVAPDLKAANARVLFSLNYPARPKALAPDADEPLRVLRQRAQAPKMPAALQQAGVLFAFQSDGLKDPKEFLKNAAKAVKEGLPSAAAVRALTINAAKIAGAGDRLGSIEKGKIANIIATDGDLFDEKVAIKHVFVDGRSVSIEPPAAPKPSDKREN